MEKETARILYYEGLYGFNLFVDKKHIKTFYDIYNFNISIHKRRNNAYHGIKEQALWHMDIEKARKYVKTIELVGKVINDLLVKIIGEKRPVVTKKDIKQGSVYLSNTAYDMYNQIQPIIAPPLVRIFRCTGIGAFQEDAYRIMLRQTHADILGYKIIMDTVPDNEKLIEVTDDEYNNLLSLKDKIIELNKNFINTSVMYHKESDFNDATDENGTC